MPFVPSVSHIPYLFTPSDCTFNQALNADFQQFGSATSFTSSVSATVGTITSYTAAGIYTQMGTLCNVQILINIITAGTTAASSMLFTLPFTSSASAWATGVAREVSINGFLYSVTVAPSSSSASLQRYDNSTALWNNGSNYTVSLLYTIA